MRDDSPIRFREVELRISLILIAIALSFSGCDKSEDLSKICDPVKKELESCSRLLKGFGDCKSKFVDELNSMDSNDSIEAKAIVMDNAIQRRQSCEQGVASAYDL